MTKYRGLTKNVFLDKLRNDGKETHRRVYGYYCKVEGEHYIIPFDAEMLDCCPNGLGIGNFVKVDSETVGKYIGMLDKNKKEIYGSIFINGKLNKGGDKYKWADSDETGDIEWDKYTSGFCRRRKQNLKIPYALHVDTVQHIEIIGTIYTINEKN